MENLIYKAGAFICITAAIIFTLAAPFAPDMTHSAIGWGNAIVWALIGNIFANLAK